ncbi:hypothetical protein TWF281_009788 [Arthrobotrys megalospora]
MEIMTRFRSPNHGFEGVLKTMVSIHNLPAELQCEILFYLIDIVDQVAAAAASPIWASLLQRKSFQQSRYQTEPKRTPGPQVHKLLLLSSRRQLNCVTRNGRVEYYGIRSLPDCETPGNPNSFVTRDISNCPFLDEPPFGRINTGTEPHSFNIDSTTWMPEGYAHYRKLPVPATIRGLLEEFFRDIRARLENSGLSPNLFQEISLYEFIPSREHKPSDRIGYLNGCIVRRSVDQYNQWVKDQGYSPSL